MCGVAEAIAAWRLVLELIRNAKIDPERYQESLNLLTEIFASMVTHADELSKCRCPYKNRLNQCTAKLGFRNKRRPLVAAACQSVRDDQLD